MNLKYLFKTGILMLSMGLIVSCSDDDDDLGPGDSDAQTYETQVYLTDSPVDNAEVQGVFVTVANVMINGQAVEGFEKTTIEVSSLHSGQTELLGSLDLESGTTSDITLVLDNETDASGEAPGNYVLTTSGEKSALVSGSNELSLSDNVEIHESNDNEVVLDFDLRKAVVTDESGEYSFASDSRLTNSIRAVNSIETGAITGNVSDFGSASADAYVVYAYEAGTYGESETSADDEGLRFANAVNSTVVAESNGDFELHFIEEGDYELHFASYEDTDADGQLEFKGELEAVTATDVDTDLLDLSVDANTELSLEVVIIGLLNL
ncbi:MAG: DUF4382 domain-containing protein [Bacteroidota bacterium]